MSVWKYVEGDTYTHGRLEQIRQVTAKNLSLATKDIEKFKTYQKYGLPNYRFNLLRRQVRIDELFESLHNIEKAIKEGQGIQDREIDIANHAA